MGVHYETTATFQIFFTVVYSRSPDAKGKRSETGGKGALMDTAFVLRLAAQKEPEGAACLH